MCCVCVCVCVLVIHYLLLQEFESFLAYFSHKSIFFIVGLTRVKIKEGFHVYIFVVDEFHFTLHTRT